MTDTYDELLRILRSLNPYVVPEEGQRIALVAALVSPTNEYRQLLGLRRLVEDYLAAHDGYLGRACLCDLCERARVLTNRPNAMQTELPLEVA